MFNPVQQPVKKCDDTVGKSVHFFFVFFVALSDWPQMIPREQVSVIELEKNQFLSFEREYP